MFGASARSIRVSKTERIVLCRLLALAAIAFAATASTTASAPPPASVAITVGPIGTLRLITAVFTRLVNTLGVIIAAGILASVFNLVGVGVEAFLGPTTGTQATTLAFFTRTASASAPAPAPSALAAAVFVRFAATFAPTFTATLALLRRTFVDVIVFADSFDFGALEGWRFFLALAFKAPIHIDGSALWPVQRQC
jgi:hypothetical protein